MKCPECSTTFTPWRIDQGYCSSACNTSATRRAQTRARTLYNALYWWRYERKSSTKALLFICREIRAWIDEDRGLGRGPPPRYNPDRDYGHQRKRAA